MVSVSAAYRDHNKFPFPGNGITYGTMVSIFRGASIPVDDGRKINGAPNDFVAGSQFVGTDGKIGCRDFVADRGQIAQEIGIFDRILQDAGDIFGGCSLLGNLDPRWIDEV